MKKAERLEDIGFYTLENARAENLSSNSPMWRCELILTDACNFKCPYCRGVRGDCKGTLSQEEAEKIIDQWIFDNLRNIRFSGGEPTLYRHLKAVVSHAKNNGVKRIAISTNGSAELDYYKELIELGVNDISVSLDACCSSVGDKMAGGINGVWKKLTDNIRELSKLTYVTVGIVLTEETNDTSVDVLSFAHNLGVADIRIISAAQHNQVIDGLNKVPNEIMSGRPILQYRINNFRQKRNMRGIGENDQRKCFLVLDDSIVAGNYHFPCVIYFREQGAPIGKVGSNMRQERYEWFLQHDTHKDSICSQNCLDVCVDYNNHVRQLNKTGLATCR